MSRYFDNEPFLRVFKKGTKTRVGRVDKHYFSEEVRIYRFEDETMPGKAVPVYFVTISELLDYLNLQNYRIV